MTRGPGRKAIMKQAFVYILASKRNGTLYVGMTTDLIKRIWEHKNNVVRGFTSRYGVYILVYYESIEDINEAVLREKRLKKRRWKLELIEKHNPRWNDLYYNLI